MARTLIWMPGFYLLYMGDRGGCCGDFGCPAFLMFWNTWTPLDCHVLHMDIAPHTLRIVCCRVLGVFSFAIVQLHYFLAVSL